MKKKLISIALASVFAIGPTYIYALCADVITVGDLVCILDKNRSGKVGKIDVCYYFCSKVNKGGGKVPFVPPPIS